jgi:quinol monooxygenase YgiN
MPTAAESGRLAVIETMREVRADDVEGGAISMFEVSARIKVRDGELEGFKHQAAEMVRQTKEKDTKTLRYDWFLSSDGTECEVREAYVDSDGLVEHHNHIAEAKVQLFSEFADDHKMTVYGEPSPALIELADAMAGRVTVDWYSFLQGLDSEVTVVKEIPA